MLGCLAEATYVWCRRFGAGPICHCPGIGSWPRGAGQILRRTGSVQWRGHYTWPCGHRWARRSPLLEGDHTALGTEEAPVKEVDGTGAELVSSLVEMNPQQVPPFAQL